MHTDSQSSSCHDMYIPLLHRWYLPSRRSRQCLGALPSTIRGAWQRPSDICVHHDLVVVRGPFREWMEDRCSLAISIPRDLLTPVASSTPAQLGALDHCRHLEGVYIRPQQLRQACQQFWVHPAAQTYRERPRTIEQAARAQRRPLSCRTHSAGPISVSCRCRSLI
eukprot:COSAG01_NODE_7296_length_3263_cov_4.163401_2_plen_166_part_00